MMRASTYICQQVSQQAHINVDALSWYDRGREGVKCQVQIAQGPPELLQPLAHSRNPFHFYTR